MQRHICCLAFFFFLRAMSKQSQPFDFELMFRALADNTRLRLLNLMASGEICVCYFVEVLKTSQPKISRHLAYLRRAGLVESRRDGKWIHYQIAQPPDPGAAHILNEVRAWLLLDPTMRRERERLTAVCCMASPPIQIQGAPRPEGVPQK